MPCEDRDEEHEHPDQGEDREVRDDERVDHRALHAAADLHLLLDLDRDSVEDGVEDARGLAGLDHRDVEAVEGVRVARHRLREEHAALDVRAHVADDGGERLVVGLLLEDDERCDDVEARVDHRRELAREDLQRAQLDALLLPLGAARGAELGERDGPQSLLPQELARGVHDRAR